MTSSRQHDANYQAKLFIKTLARSFHPSIICLRMILSLALNYVLVPPSTGHFSTQDVLRGTMREKIIQFCNLKSDIKPPNETNLMLHKVESARDKNAGSIKRRTAIRHKEQSLTQLLHKAKSPAVGEGADPCQESHTRLSQKTTIH